MQKWGEKNKKTESKIKWIIDLVIRMSFNSIRFQTRVLSLSKDARLRKSKSWIYKSSERKITTELLIKLLNSKRQRRMFSQTGKVTSFSRLVVYVAFSTLKVHKLMCCAKLLWLTSPTTPDESQEMRQLALVNIIFHLIKGEDGNEGIKQK